MRCERAQELFSEYCEGSIQAAMRVPLESHLSGCAGCRDEVEGLRAVWSILDAAPVLEAPAGFRAAVWQRIEGFEADRRNRNRIQKLFPNWKTAFVRRPLAWVAAAAVLLAFSGFVIPGQYSPAGWLFGLVKRDTRGQFAAGNPEIRTGGHLVIPIYLVNGEGKVHTAAVPIQVRVLSGPALLTPESSSLTYDGRSPVTMELNVIPGAPWTPVVIEATRLDGGQPSTQILTIPLPQK